VNAWPGRDPRLLDPAAYAVLPNRLRFAALCAYFSRVGEVADIRLPATSPTRIPNPRVLT